MAEFVAVQKAAKARGQTVSEFVRSAIAIMLHQHVVLNAVSITTGASEGASNATFLNPGPAGSQTLNSVPQYANITR